MTVVDVEKLAKNKLTVTIVIVVVEKQTVQIWQPAYRAWICKCESIERSRHRRVEKSWIPIGMRYHALMSNSIPLNILFIAYTFA